MLFRFRGGFSLSFYWDLNPRMIIFWTSRLIYNLYNINFIVEKWDFFQVSRFISQRKAFLENLFSFRASWMRYYLRWRMVSVKGLVHLAKRTGWRIFFIFALAPPCEDLLVLICHILTFFWIFDVEWLRVSSIEWNSFPQNRFYDE